MNDFVSWLLNAVHSLDWLLRDVIALFSIAAETTIGVGVIVPGDTVVFVAGTAVTALWDFAILYVFVLVGSFCGESLGFWLGRKFGGPIRRSAIGRRIGERNWEMADVFVETRGGLAIAVSRFLPVLHSLVPVVTGMTRLRYRVFIAWTMAACSIWAAVYLGIGFALHRTYDLWLGRLKFGGALFAVLVLVVAVAISLVKRRLERSAEAMIAEGEAALEIVEVEASEGLE